MKTTNEENGQFNIKIFYGIVEPSKTCKFCLRKNHKDNTHCWNCKNLLSSKWFSVSDVEQLQKELKEKIGKYRDYHSSLFYVDIVDNVFNNFKGK